jgi:hypothetical protein
VQDGPVAGVADWSEKETGAPQPCAQLGLIYFPPRQRDSHNLWLIFNGLTWAARTQAGAAIYTSPAVVAWLHLGDIHVTITTHSIRPLHSVRLPFYRRAGGIDLSYVETDPEKTQPRVLGRHALMPALSLKSYRVSAAIDWIQVHVVLDRVTHVAKLRSVLKAAIGESLRVDSVNGDRHHRDAAWLIKFQDPERFRTAKAIDALRREFGLVGEPELEAIEVSVDFYPKVPTDAARHQMVGVLQRHLLVPEVPATAERGLPRMLTKKGAGGVVWLHTDGAFNEDEQKRDPRTTEMYIDCTLQVGEKGVGAGWRVMDKTTDKRTDDTHEPLPAEKRRARVEVTLNKDELRKKEPGKKELGLVALSDLEGFRFEMLKARYFPFFLPTVRVRGTDKPARWIQTELDARYVDRFLRLGVMGLRAWERRAYVTVKASRKTMARDKRATLPPLRRLGQTGTLVEFGTLNERVRGALRSLRW